MADEEGKDSIEKETRPKVRVIAPIEGLDRRAKMAPGVFTTIKARMCAFHGSIPATYICAKCSKPLCISCAIPHGHLFLCPQCYIPPQPPPMQAEQQERAQQKPPMESIIGFFGALLVIVGFFMPWVTSDYLTPGSDDYGSSVISGFNIAGDYPETALVLTMGILIIVVEFLLLILGTSPTMARKPPIGLRLLPMFLGFIAYVVLVEVALRAEEFINNINFGWFVCLIGANITLVRGGMVIYKHYKGYDD